MSIRRTPTSVFWLTPIRLISGVMMLSVNLVTNAVNAVPMTTATARSTILPRERNSLNPLSIADVLSGLDTDLLRLVWRAAARQSVQGEGHRLTQRRACDRVRHASRQRN